MFRSLHARRPACFLSLNTAAGLLLALTLILPTVAGASTTHLPEWFQFSAVMAAPPEIGKPITVLATLTALVGDLTDVRVAILAPPGWLPASPTAELARLENGRSQTFAFEMKTDKPLPNGSLQCSFSSRVPKDGLIKAINTPANEEREAMTVAIRSFPDRGQGFADIAFSVFPEEGFFPLGSDMWLTYDDRLKNADGLRGPVLFQNALLTTFQAQTDVEMYQKLQQTLKADPAFADQIKTAGIDLNRKRSDYLAALYTLAAEAFLKGDYVTTMRFLDQLETDNPQADQQRWEEQTIAEGNLRGLCLWAQGEKKRAEDTLRQVFYKNRKNPVQRYVLRNLGLLYLDMGNPSTAREMLRLGLDFKPEYTLLAKELDLVTHR